MQNWLQRILMQWTALLHLLEHLPSLSLGRIKINERIRRNEGEYVTLRKSSSKYYFYLNINNGIFEILVC